MIIKLGIYLLPDRVTMIATSLQGVKSVKHTHITTKKIVLVALLAALTVAGSFLRIPVPSVVGTSAFHLGNILCALSGILLGPWWGGLAAGLGSAIFDMMNPLYISDCWITFLTKGAYGLVAGLIAWSGSKPWHVHNHQSYIKALVATVAGAITYAVLYLAKSYFYSGLLLHGLTHTAAMLNVIDKLPATVFNAAVAVIGAPLLAAAISKALEKAHLTLE